VLIDAVGIEVPGHPVADFFSLTTDEVFQRSFHTGYYQGEPQRDRSPAMTSPAMRRAS